MQSIIVQQISVTWSKRERGAPAATVRNALPRAVPVICSSGAYLYQHHRFSRRGDGDGYSHHLREDRVSDLVPTACQDLSLSLDADRLSVRISGSRLGKPIRGASEVIQLALGQTVRFMANGRHTYSDGDWVYWYYSREIYNVALVAEPTPDLFTRAAPERIVRFEADLF
jgi:hypothetical protein